MSARSIYRFFPVLLTLFLCAPLLRAEDAPEIENSKFQAEGQINGNAIYIRSGPQETDYPTMKLDRGAAVTVVGVRGDWLKITPPDGSYCYVAKAYVEKRGDGTVGRVTNPLRVRVGSQLNAMKTKVAAQLETGDDVKILGEQDEYFKIAPPKNVFLYVHKQYVDVVKTIGVAAADQPKSDTPTGQAVAPPGTDGVTPTPPTKLDAIVGNTTPPAGGTQNSIPPAPGTTGDPVVIATPATMPAGDPNTIAAAPATQPADAQANAETSFDQLEKSFMENTRDMQSLDAQPLVDLKTGYEKLAAGNLLPESLHRMCDYRIGVLKQRIDDTQRFAAVKKSQDDMKQRQLALQAEREELESRIKASGVKYFTAVGTLRVSSLQQGNTTLYRLTDPNTGRTVVYLRSDDAKLGALTGQFIGVQGKVDQEQSLNLKSITPTSFEIVDQSKVNVSVAAQIVPTSLMPSGTASISGNN